MPVTVTETVATYAGNESTTTPYPITIPRDRDEDLKLKVNGVDNTNFTISPDGFRTGLAYASTVALVLYRETPRTQIQPFPPNTTPAAEDIREGLDKLTMVVQEVDEAFSRTLKTEIGAPFVNDSTLGIDVNGTPVSRTLQEQVDYLTIGPQVAAAETAATTATSSASEAVVAKDEAVSAQELSASTLLDLATRSFPRVRLSGLAFGDNITTDVTISFSGGGSITFKNSARPYSEPNAINAVGATAKELIPDIVAVLNGNVIDYDSSYEYGIDPSTTVSNYTPIIGWGAEYPQFVPTTSNQVADLIYYGGGDTTFSVPSPFIILGRAELEPPASLPFINSANTVELPTQARANLALQWPEAVASDVPSHLAVPNPHNITTFLIGAASQADLDALADTQTSGRIAYQTLADLAADLAQDENTLAEVTNDAPNNGTYIKVGASGAGSWLKSTNDLSGRVTTLEDGDSGYSGLHWALVDSNQKIIGSWDQLGRFLTEFMPGSIPTDALTVFPDGSGYSGFEYLVIDANENILTGTYTGGMDIANPELPEFPAPVPSIGLWGDSTSNGTYDTQLSLLTGGTVNEYGFSGEKSHEIVERFLVRSDTEDILLFWIGQNDANEFMAGSTMQSMNKAIADFPDGQKWLISSPHAQLDEGTSSDAYLQKVLLRDTIARLYPDRFVDLWTALVYDYNYGGFELDASFVQPAIGGTVTITLNTTTNLATYWSGWGSNTPPNNTREHEAEFYLGPLGSIDDRYEVISIDSGTTITAQRVSGSTTTGSTISNDAEGSGYELKKRFVLARDASAFNSGIPPRSLMSDNTHPGDRGNQLIADTIYQKLKTLNWL